MNDTIIKQFGNRCYINYCFPQIDKYFRYSCPETAFLMKVFPDNNETRGKYAYYNNRVYFEFEEDMVLYLLRA